MAQVFADADQLVAVDGGLVHCVDLGVWPSVLLGDLDSAPPALVEQANLHQVRLLTFPADKDATDLELARVEGLFGEPPALLQEHLCGEGEA